MASYQTLYQSGELAARAARARAMLSPCHLCPRRCQVDRSGGESGACRTGATALVSSYGPHLGEEAPLVGRHGSGTIFFTNCTLRCMFCQNYTISQRGEGWPATAGEIAAMMLSLERRGCHNINLVTPTHVVPQILEALIEAAAQGLSVPLVYNCGGYESLETLRLLDGVVDIYMPDMKYSDETTARRLSGVKGYPAANREAVREMHRQVGDLALDDQGIAQRGLLVRHLVLPNGLAGTEGVVRFIASEVSTHTYLNVMAQYRPAHRAHRLPALSRPLTTEEYAAAVALALRYELGRLDGVKSRTAMERPQPRPG